jgi:delta24-sterol reductase
LEGTMGHDGLVADIRKQILARPSDQHITVAKKRPGHTPHDYRYKTGRHAVDVSKLDNVLSVDPVTRLAVAEGEVNMGELCNATLPYGLVPAVVPELETFTVAGLINGLGIETSSHKHGIFPVNVPTFEVVLGNGDVLEVDPKRHRDLYTTLPGSYGSLGIVTKATIQLVDAKPFIRSSYHHFERLGDYVAAFGNALDHHAFVEGFVIAPNSHVLVTSDFSVADPDLATYHAMKHGNLWYYEHSTKMAKRAGVDLVPTYEYLFRHQRSLLWISRFANFLHLPMTRLGRWMLDREVTRSLHELGLTSFIPHTTRERSVVMQDAAVMLGRLEEGIRYVEEHFGVYPIWNCPACRASRGPYAEDRSLELLFCANQKYGPERRKELEEKHRFVVDLGVYGEPTAPNFHYRDAINGLQNFVDMPAMWGVCYLTESQFREFWDVEKYEAVRRRYHAIDAFVPLQDKVMFREAEAKKQERAPFWRAIAMYHHFRGRYLAG